ncbi:MAG: aminotransferase class III-fold pyridoxal phosphate-dependent enzyme [Phycisphaerales bacterium]|nr:aminotransferase class III-fold pyridoxal phosphate-dependent enzyme [Phycisphaerales bacterium]
MSPVQHHDGPSGPSHPSSKQDALRDQAAEIAAREWGASPDQVVRLSGENLNYLCDVGVLKVSVEEDCDLDLEEAVQHVLEQAGLPVPCAQPSKTGERVVDVEIDGVQRPARMQRRLPGVQWREAPATPDLLANIGSMIAHIHQALAGFSHSGSGRTHPWSLEGAGMHRKCTPHIQDEALRRAADRAFQLHAALDLSDCPRGMLHGDVNNENILVDGEDVTAVLDFGDCLEGPLVADLAITLAYAFQHEGMELETAAAIVEGYDRVRPLDLSEQQALFPLMLARLATSACFAAVREETDPAHATWYGQLQSTREPLLKLAETAPRDAETALASACRVRRGACEETASLVERRRAHLPGVLSLSYASPLHIVQGRGQYLSAADGRVYLDLVNNVCHVGHCHPQVVRSLSEQAGALNTNTRYLHENVLAYTERLTGTLPDGLDVCFLVNSGSEANELALRLARAATGRHDVMVIDGAYHGSTGTCIEMSPYKFKGPGGAGKSEWVHVVPAPDTYRRGVSGEGLAGEVSEVIQAAAADGRSIAGFFAEPLLSCGGQIPLPAGYLAEAFAHVRAAGGVCIADEVQVGFGRVGEAMWGFELQGVVPDIVVMGKPIGNGHPLGAVVCTRAIADAFDCGMEFFSTFGGNPVSCACGLAVLDVIEEKGLQDRAQKLGQHFLKGLRSLKKRHEIIGDVRGSGLFLGIELVRNHETLEPADSEATEIVNAMRQRGVLLSTDGPLHNVI